MPPPLTRGLAEIEADISALEHDLRLLRIRASRLRAEVESSGTSIRVGVEGSGNNIFIGASGPAASSGASAGSSPSPSDNTGGLDLRVAKGPPPRRVPKYYVVTLAPKDLLPEGIYTSYSEFVACVVDEESKKTWNGRGKIPFSRGMECWSTPNQVEAEKHYRDKVGLAGSEPAPY